MCDQRFFELSDVSCSISKWGKVTKREWLRRLRGPRSKCSNPFLLAAALPSRCALPPLLHCHLYFSGWYFLIFKTPVKIWGASKYGCPLLPLVDIFLSRLLTGNSKKSLSGVSTNSDLPEMEVQGWAKFVLCTQYKPRASSSQKIGYWVNPLKCLVEDAR